MKTTNVVTPQEGEKKMNKIVELYKERQIKTFNEERDVKIKKY